MGGGGVGSGGGGSGPAEDGGGGGSRCGGWSRGRGLVGSNVGGRGDVG